MIDDTLWLTVDKVFGIKYSKYRFINGKFNSPFHVDGYSDEEITYYKIFDFRENFNGKKMNIFIYLFFFLKFEI